MIPIFDSRYYLTSILYKWKKFQTTIISIQKFVGNVSKICNLQIQDSFIDIVSSNFNNKYLLIEEEGESRNVLNMFSFNVHICS